MTFRLIDTHCHVHFQAYQDDMDEVVKRSLDAGVGMITVGTQSTTSKNGLALAERFEGVWTTIGLHPNHLHQQEFFDENELPKIKTRAETFDPDYYRELAKHPKVVAVGEFGLDYYRIPPGLDAERVKRDQMESVRAQLQFATDVDKPVVIHCRDAHADQAALLRDAIVRGGLARRGVIHCFTGSVDEAAVYRELGFLVSITGIVTFAKNLQEVVAAIPLEQMMIETDSPYLTPAPNRGKRNEPRYVEYVAQKIAELKGVSFDEVARVTTENAMRVFDLSS